LLALLFLLAACQPQASSPSPSTLVALPSPSAAGLSLSCEDIQLQAPNGDEVWLEGIWHGNEDAYWVFTQVGECVWATATDSYPTPNDPDAAWQIYLRGIVKSDLTIPVEFAYSSLGTAVGPHYGHAVLSIEFAADGSTTGMKLHKIAGCGASDPECPSLQTTEWTLVSSELILPPPTPG
jgi:hypothetical protein